MNKTHTATGINPLFLLEELVFVIKAPLAAQLSQLLPLVSASVSHFCEARGDETGMDKTSWSSAIRASVPSSGNSG